MGIMHHTKKDRIFANFPSFDFFYKKSIKMMKLLPRILSNKNKLYAVLNVRIYIFSFYITDHSVNRLERSKIFL